MKSEKLIQKRECEGTQLIKSKKDFYVTTTKQQIVLKIGNITNYITFSPQVAHKLIEAGISEDIFKYKVYL